MIDSLVDCSIAEILLGQGLEEDELVSVRASKGLLLKEAATAKRAEGVPEEEIGAPLLGAKGRWLCR